MRVSAWRSDWLLAALLGVFFLCLYLLSGSSDLKHNGDTDLRYQTAQAVVDHHRLWIDHPMWLDTRVARGRGGHLYAFYAPGQTLLMVPLYVAGKVIAHHLSLPYDISTLYASRSTDLFLGAMLAVLFFWMAKSAGFATRTSALLTLVFGLATAAWPDAQSALEQTQVDLFLLLAVYGVWNFVRRGFQSRWWLILAGSGAGLALFTRYDAALYLPLVALYPAVLRWTTSHRREIALDVGIYSLAAAPWIGLVAAWNFARFGSPFLTGLHEQTFGEPPWLGLLGLTISPGKGILWYLPLLFLLPWAMPRFYRRNPSLSIFLSILTVITLLFYSGVLYWHGDPAWGPRYLYVVVTYLVLPLGEVVDGWPSLGMTFRSVALALLAASLVLQVAAVSVTQWRFWYRLQADEQRTSQPFRWGAQHYHYYWQVAESPLLIQLDDVYQVARLELGDGHYRFAAKPDPHVSSNPAVDYPINSFAFWWADTRHPLLGQRTRGAIALLLASGAGLSLLLLLRRLQGPSERVTRAPGELELSSIEGAGN